MRQNVCIILLESLNVQRIDYGVYMKKKANNGTKTNYKGKLLGTRIYTWSVPLHKEDLTMGVHEEEVVTELRQTIKGSFWVQESIFRAYHCTKKT